MAINASPVVAADGMTGDWGGARTSPAARGVSGRGFATGQINGTGDKVWDAFGRYGAFVDLDFGKMGLVKGLGFHAHGEDRFWQGQSNLGFQLCPASSSAIRTVTVSASAGSTATRWRTAPVARVGTSPPPNAGWPQF